MQEFKVDSESEGWRADIFVASKYPQFSRSALELLFDKGEVSVNGHLAKASTRLKNGDAVNIDETDLNRQPPAIKLPIIYEDEDVRVIDKPAGILTHSKGALNLEASVASFIAGKLNDPALSGNRAGIIHRLDRDTSGVIITAKNASSLASLQRQFSRRRASKTYIAVVEGKLTPEEAIIDAPIMRNPAKPQTFKVGATGRPSQTQYKVLKTFQRNKQDFSLVELTPKTGRTHQLRVHLAYVHHPIVGDKIYGHNGHQLLLHALSLELNLPKGRRQKFSAGLPTRIKEFADV